MTGTGGWLLLFLAGAGVSLAGSWVLVTRLERLGERAGFSEAWLGLVAALAADAPEITSAVTALARGQSSVGAGVVIGSGVFNLAALLGVAALVAGRIGFHRRVVLLGGVPGIWIAVVCVVTVAGVLPPAAGLVLAGVVLVPYAAVLGLRRARLEQLRLPGGWSRWLMTAVHDEEDELSEVIRPRPGTWHDAVTAALALITVVAASTLMELAATGTGRRYGVADIVTGGLVLAVVTSLPNAVSAVYLATRGRGAAVLSTALNSNAINVVAGLLVPASITGLGPRSGQNLLVAGWYAGLTGLALVLAWRQDGLTRLPGAVIIAGYLAFVAALALSVVRAGISMATAVAPAAVVAVGGAVVMAAPARPPGWWRPASVLPGWSAGRVWLLSLAACSVIAVCDAVSGPRLVLIGWLACGPCCALLTARWRLAVAAGGFALALAVVLGVPDHVFATGPQYVCLAGIGAVSAVACAGAAVLQRRGIRAG